MKEGETSASGAMLLFAPLSMQRPNDLKGHVPHHFAFFILMVGGEIANIDFSIL